MSRLPVCFLGFSCSCGIGQFIMLVEVVSLPRLKENLPKLLLADFDERAAAPCVGCQLQRVFETKQILHLALVQYVREVGCQIADRADLVGAFHKVERFLLKPRIHVVFQAFSELVFKSRFRVAFFREAALRDFLIGHAEVLSQRAGGVLLLVQMNADQLQGFGKQLVLSLLCQMITFFQKSGAPPG